MSLPTYNELSPFGQCVIDRQVAALTNLNLDLQPVPTDPKSVFVIQRTTLLRTMGGIDFYALEEVPARCNALRPPHTPYPQAVRQPAR